MSALIASLPAPRAISASEALISTGTEWGSTRWSTLETCRQKYDLRYRLRVVPRSRPIDFVVGSLVHAGITYVESACAAGQSADWRDVIREAERQARELEAQSLGLEEESDPGLEVCWEAERLLSAYDAHWDLEENAGWPHGLRIVATELKLETSFYGIPLTGRLDTLLQREETGDLIIVDTKTAASRVSEDSGRRQEWIAGKSVRPQFLMLSYMLQRELGLPEPPEFMVNQLSKSRLPIAERLALKITQGAIDRWAENQLALAQDFSRGVVPIKNYSACAPGLGPRCEYFKYCHGSEAQQEAEFKKEGEQS